MFHTARLLPMHRISPKTRLPQASHLAFAGLATAAALLSGCAATPTVAGADSVMLVTDAPDPARCQFVKEVVGTQGNFITGDFTANKDLIVGARNALRNEAVKVGANVVYIQDQKTINAFRSTGAVNATVVGNAYRCAR